MYVTFASAILLDRDGNLQSQEFLLIDAQRPMLEVYRREKHDFWILRAYRLDEEVELTNLGVHFAVSEVYEDVIFPPPDESTRL